MAFDTTPWIRDGDTVDAEVIRRALGTLIGTAGGIVTPGDLNVTQNGTPNMSVNAGTGQIWVPGTSTSTQGPYYGMNKATVNVPINAADPTNPRVDTIVVQVEDSSYGGSGTAMAPVALAGTPTAGVSTPPTTAAQAASDGAATVPASAYVVAYVLVPAGASSISNADISNVATQVTPLGAPVTLSNPARAWNTAYEPNASRPTLVVLTAIVNGSSVSEVDVFVGPTSSPVNEIARIGGGTTSTTLQATATFLVPPGWYYKMTPQNSPTLQSLYEYTL